MKAFIFCVLMFALGATISLVGQESSKAAIEPSKLLEIAKLQRDLSSLQARATSLQSQIQEMQTTYLSKNQALQALITEIEKTHKCKLDQEKLECVEPKPVKPETKPNEPK